MSPTSHDRYNELLDEAEFTRRHIATSLSDQHVMLATLGVASIEALLDEVVPHSIRSTVPLALDAPRREDDVLAELRSYAARNRVVRSLIGKGYYGTITPPVIQRNVLENPAWYTAYTPYQPEISQGRLEALLNFQTAVADLTGMDLANASMLDEGTAAAEAMTMCRRLSKAPGDSFFVHADIHPQTLTVLTTRAEPLGIDVIVGDAPVDGVFGALLSTPGSSGQLYDWTTEIERLHTVGCVVAVATDLLACTLIRPPGQMGADIAVGSAQRFGVPLGFGGPHAGFLACHTSAARALPGRLVGVSTDGAGRPALRLALQTREQHIRREKATSNICTAQVLLANIAGLYAVWHGPEGLRTIASRAFQLASVVAAALGHVRGVSLINSTWFDTLTVAVPDADTTVDRALASGLNIWRVDGRTVAFSFDERSTWSDAEALVAALGGRLNPTDATYSIAPEHRRDGEILPHPVFHRYHAEHEMLRYLRRLADLDLALDRTMIPLGSCTMKLNSTSEMLAISWPEFADIHPFAPSAQTEGYRALIADLEHRLAVITGYDRVSVQPNAGSQGELAGLLAIRAFHRSRGEAHRDVCLIPSSAHGTNAASAVMAAMRVVVVACDERGNVDLEDLDRKLAQFADSLAAIMITYPSTHGVFEAGVTEICDRVHAVGAQVYVDGANLNALVGVAQPGAFGGDVSHLNLHKTFCIPHGGGGPGVGPVAVREHLAAFLPGSADVPAISAAPFGSALILPISWTYIALMGSSGLSAATGSAILNANYIAERLEPHFPVLYRGAHGRVAHECIVDVRPLTKATGVTVDDIAKRLIDYGFHAPTMSFPVAGTLMIEPTESESLAEINRFIDAMIAIRSEIAAVERGAVAVDDSALRHAPHTAADLLADDWSRSYTRRSGAYPTPALEAGKYFPPVSRIDAAYGDRNLVCTCDPIEAYAADHGTVPQPR